MHMERQLTEEEIALYVDALELKKLEGLPEAIVDHVQECLECKMEIVEVWELIEEQEAQ